MINIVNTQIMASIIDTRNIFKIVNTINMPNIVNIIIVTSITAFIVLGIRMMLKNKISPKWQLVLWVIFAVRLLMPVLPESNLSIFNKIPYIENIESTSSNDNIKFSSNTQNLKTTQEVKNTKLSNSKYYYKGNLIIGNNNKQFWFNKKLANSLIMIWIIGCVILFLYMTIIYYIYHLKTKKLNTVDDFNIISILEECKQKLDINRNIKLLKGGDTPLLKGMLSPTIILPEGYTKQELRSIFLHELFHYKYKDVFWSIIATLILCIYWYNPLIWFSFFAFKHDMEILCDYRVLQVYNNRKQYGSVLLKTALAKNKFILATTSMQNGKKEISKRIKYIAYFKKPKVIWSSIGAIVAIILMIVCLTNPIKSSNSKNYYDKKTKLNYEEIYEYKTLYVGNASKVSGLASNIYYSEFKNGISLQTENQPYGMTINYSQVPKELLQDGAVSVTNKMIKNAEIMFCLIDNVDKISFVFHDSKSGAVYNFPFERDFIENQVFKESIRKYSSSFSKFKDEFISKIEKQNWDDIKNKINSKKM